MFQYIMNKHQRKQNGQSTIDNPEKQTTTETTRKTMTTRRQKYRTPKTISNMALTIKPGVDPGSCQGYEVYVSHWS